MVRITTLPPATGFIMPTLEDLSSLRKIVLAVHHAWLGDGEGSELNQERAFRRAFFAVGRMFRRREPRRDRYFHSFVASANDRLSENGGGSIDGRDFMLAALAHCDVVWQKPDASNGVLAEIGLYEYSGLPCTNAWRRLLSGEANLLAPVVPARLLKSLEADRVPRPRVYEVDRATGETREMFTPWRP